MENKRNVMEQLASGELQKPGCFGFYDWFCSDKSLQARSARLIGKLNKVLKYNAGKFDVTKVYVFFKNNCPMVGNLYDDFRICDIETGDVLFTITPSMGYSTCKGKSNLWGRIDGEWKEIIIAGTWEDILIWFGKPDTRQTREAKRISAAQARLSMEKRDNLTRRILRMREQQAALSAEIAAAETELETI